MNLSELNPIYKYLPLCSSVEKTEQGLKVTTYKTYPAFPWKPGTGDHRNDDPVYFIKLCEQAGLVTWETAEQRAQRLKETGYMTYKEYEMGEELVKRL